VADFRTVQICTLFALTALLCAPDVFAQGLGSLATQTAEERASSGRAPGRRITNANLDQPGLLEEALRDFELTEDRLWKYFRARTALLEVRTKSIRLDQYLLAAENAGAGPLTIEQRIIAERQLLDCLDWERISPREFTVTEAAYHRARADALLPDTALANLPPTRAANARFARKNEIQISNALSQWADKQKWLDIQRRAYK
jgi:hypothetical protein